MPEKKKEDHMPEKNPTPDISVILPCRNEINTVALCVAKAGEEIEKLGLNGEIIVADNLSEDGSAKAAAKAGAKVITVKRLGYGFAIRAGIKKSLGRVIVIADSDLTYDFSEIGSLYYPISEENCDLVIGNRFAGGIEGGAMSGHHKAGVRFLSAVGRHVTKTDVYDFHCGFRALSREAAKILQTKTGGMEYASEMIALAAEAGLRIKEVPLKLKKCPVSRQSKLNTVRDGMRHMMYLAGFAFGKR